ncbi:MAG TPA: C80 family cysteine peptidase [Rhabdochlamydiaceae bacterium]|nr:C80 family cysteine peptidase [Rhabdochlamydiaceae bacterium]
MCTQKVSSFAKEILAYPLVKSDHEILEALKKHAPTKEIETLRKEVTITDAILLDEAVKYNNPAETIRFLLNAGAKPAWGHLKQALQGQYTKEVIALLVHQMDKSDLEVALLLAIECGKSFEILKLLIEAGAPCEHICVLRVIYLKPSPAIVDLVTDACQKWVEKLRAHREKREEEHKKPPKYDYQLIFDMREGSKQAEALAQKAKNNGIPTDILNLKKDPTKEQMERVTHRSRVYIIAHGSEGVDSLRQGKIEKTFQNFADIFSLSPKLNEEPKNNQRVKISLVICEGATDGDKGEKSFAEKLSNSLYSKGILAEVVARKGESSTDKIYMRKLVGEKHHAEGTKFSFITTEKGTLITPIKYHSH